ncbi:hypothetical protein VR46_31990 [Streptomyces sp. NRRL S-444]|nr:hypothetical protein VR46_31990 [Streptomyces sp. NRRL S-444]
MVVEVVDRRGRRGTAFLDPDWSIAGFCGERVYGDADIDADAFLEAFQVPNGSVSSAPGASAFFLLHTQRPG